MYLCTRQQRELHELKKKLAEEELLRVTKTRTFEEKKAELELEKAAAEAELASLRLKVHKERSSEASVME
ncbi:hypothetical protein FQA39_LY04007 [Lamprigera yunnana]|nr:hypothetical protein FQA39_LY04007 [Lamprigera yunnana]